MTEYHKINAPFKRDKKGVMLMDDWCMEEFYYLAGLEWEFTEKVDGTNIRIYADRKPYEHSADVVFNFAGRTDNAQTPKPLLDALDSIFNTETTIAKFAAVMDKHEISSLVVYGEGYGPKINGGGKYTDIPNFVAFDIKVGNFWLKRADVDDFCKNVGIESVPVLGSGTLWSGFDLVRTGRMRSMSGGIIMHTSNKFTGLRSMWGGFEAEGIIAVPKVPLFDRAGRRIITKIKSKDFR